MVHVERHDIDRDWHREEVAVYAHLRERQVQKFRAGATSPYPLFEVLDSAWQRIACGDSAGSIYEDVVLAHEVHKAFYILVHDPDNTFRIRLGTGEPVTLPGRRGKDIRTSTWIRAFWLARLLQDNEGLDWLCNVPVDVLRLHTETNEHHHLWAAALQGVYQDAADVSAHVAAALAAAEGCLDQTVPPMRDWAVHRSIPAYRTLAAALAGDAVGFNENLLAALRLYRAYWDNDKGRRNASALVALDLTGIAAVAFDRGMPVEVTSDYLPEYLFEGAFRYPPP